MGFFSIGSTPLATTSPQPIVLSLPCLFSRMPHSPDVPGSIGHMRQQNEQRSAGAISEHLFEYLCLEYREITLLLIPRGRIQPCFHGKMVQHGFTVPPLFCCYLGKKDRPLVSTGEQYTIASNDNLLRILDRLWN